MFLTLPVPGHNFRSCWWATRSLREKKYCNKMWIGPQRHKWEPADGKKVEKIEESSSEAEAHQLSVSVSRLPRRCRHRVVGGRKDCGTSHACRAQRAGDNRSRLHPWASSSSPRSCGMFWFVTKTSASRSPDLRVRLCLAFVFYPPWSLIIIYLSVFCEVSNN